MKPFTDNVIFWDTEMSTLNPYEGEIISMGFVKPGGEELYVEVEHNGSVHPWVERNVMPYLSGEKVTREEAVKQLYAFIGNTKPFMVAYANYFDVVFLYKLTGMTDNTKDFPFHWMHIDFASMLFANGIDPQRLSSSHPESMLPELGLDPNDYQRHHALDDAKMLRDVYQKLAARA